MVIAGVLVFLCIFELFLAMLSASPKPRPEIDWNAECHSDTEL